MCMDFGFRSDYISMHYIDVICPYKGFGFIIFWVIIITADLELQ
jgi:hypothetical protein